MTDASQPAPLPFPSAPEEVPCVIAAVRGNLDASTPASVLASIAATINEALGALEKVLSDHGAPLLQPRIAVAMHPMLPICVVQAIGRTTAKVRDNVTANAKALAKALATERHKNGKVIALPPGVAR